MPEFDYLSKKPVQCAYLGENLFSDGTRPPVRRSYEPLDIETLAAGAVGGSVGMGDDPVVANLQNGEYGFTHGLATCVAVCMYGALTRGWSHVALVHSVWAQYDAMDRCREALRSHGCKLMMTILVGGQEASFDPEVTDIACLVNSIEDRVSYGVQAAVVPASDAAAQQAVCVLAHAGGVFYDLHQVELGAAMACD